MKHCFQKMMYKSLCHYFDKNKEIRKIKLFSLLKTKIQNMLQYFITLWRNDSSVLFLIVTGHG